MSYAFWRLYSLCDSTFWFLVSAIGCYKGVVFSIQYGSLVVSYYKQAMKETKYKLKLLAAIIYVGTYVYLLYFLLTRIQSTQL